MKGFVERQYMYYQWGMDFRNLRRTLVLLPGRVIGLLTSRGLQPLLQPYWGSLELKLREIKSSRSDIGFLQAAFEQALARV